MATGPFVVNTNAKAPYCEYRKWYRSKRVNGVLVLENNPFVSAKVSLTNRTAQNDGALGNTMGNSGLAYYYTEPRTAVSAFGPTLYAKAYDRFADKIWGDAQAALAVDIGERRETLAMLTDTLGRLYKAVVLTRKRRFSDAMRALSAVPPGKKWRPSEEFFSNWMALRYGWIPTLGSVHSLCEALAQPIKGKTGVSRGSCNGTFSEDKWDQWGYHRYKRDYSIHVHVQGRVEISDSRLASLNQYGLLNPAAVAWELVSKSFVVGWFLPIGDIIADQTRFVGLKIVEGCVVYRISGEDEMYLWGPPFPKYTSYLKERQPFTTFPPIPSRFALSNGMNPKRCMDALALLVGALRH